MKKTILTCALILGSFSGITHAATIATWTFETSVPNSTGAAITGLSAEVGTGTASGLHASAATVYSNPSGNGSAESFSANTWATGDYFQFQVSTVGFAGIVLNWDQTRSGTGPSVFNVQYSLNGSDFITFSSVTVAQVTWTVGTPVTNSSYSANLSSITVLDNAPTAYFRLTSTETTAVAGTNRVDNFTVAEIPEPSTALLGLLASLGLMRRRR